MPLFKRRVVQVFKYLRALDEYSNPAVQDIQEQPWSCWLDDLPDHPAITLASRSKSSATVASEPTLGESTEPVDDAVLRVRRPKVTRPPAPPDSLRDWLATGWDDPETGAKTHETRNHETPSGQLRIEQFGADTSRVTSFELWNHQREEWRKAEIPTRKALKVFDWLYELHGRIERDGEKLDLMLGDGFISWKREEGSLYHPVLLQRVDLRFNTQVPEFTISFADSPPELYSRLFQGIPGVDGNVLQALRSELEQGGYHPLAIDSDGYLKSLVVRLSSHGQFIERQRPTKDSEQLRVGRVHCLFLRSRTLGFARAIEGAIDRLESTADICVGLLNIVGHAVAPQGDLGVDLSRDSSPRHSPRSDVLFSKDSNAEQLQIAERLDQFGAVIVQGPPGTGKSHTIANLIGHLLANNKSVLVTSHTTKALRVLRGHVDKSLRSLCVSVLDRDAESREELKSAVEDIQYRLSNRDEDNLELQSSKLVEERKTLTARLRAANDELLKARTYEYRDIVIAGVATPPSDAARFVRDFASVHGWIPGPMSLGAGPPLSDDELAELYATTIATTQEDDLLVGEAAPDTNELLKPERFEEIVTNISTNTSPLTPTESELWPGVQFSIAKLQQIELLGERMVLAVSTCKQANEWQYGALDAGRGTGEHRTTWEHLLGKIDEASKAVAASHLALLQHRPTIRETAALPEQLAVVKQIQAHLQNGGKLGTLSTLMKPSWNRLLGEWRVRGVRPTTSDHFRALEMLIICKQQQDELAVLWDGLLARYGERTISDLGETWETVCTQYAAIIRDHLYWWRNSFSPLVNQLEGLGFRWQTFVNKQSPVLESQGDLKRIVQAVERNLIPHIQALAVKLRARANHSSLATLDEKLSKYPLPVINRLRQAIARQSPLEYRTAFHDAVRAFTIRPAVMRRQAILSKLEQSAPGWALQFRNRHGSHEGATLPGDYRLAWKWRQFFDELARRDKVDSDRLTIEIEQRRKELQRVTADLIEKRTWANQKRRTTHSQRQALNGWVDTIRRLGAGYIKRAPELTALARRCMLECCKSVPVWIMPITRVVENFDFRTTTFDVVIIDEASQCDVRGLLALAIAKQVIVVGDHEQVSPTAVGEKQDVVSELNRQYLGGIPHAELYDGRRSVYDLAKSFEGLICLREHYRCVPDIIQFSNHLSYDGRIEPLREPKSSPLQPSVVPYRVDSASRDGKVNAEEVFAVASLVIAAIRHPAYLGQTMGVISLLGEDQAWEIDVILRQELSPEEYERRRLVCGNPAQLQGDERDVVFLSMVDTPREGPLRMLDTPQFKQRYNVAASRARNQLWVVHSLSMENDLKPGDLRRRLLEHAYDPRAIERRVEETERETESEFERLVLRRLLSAGYRVTPQFAVGSYRIDLVVHGAGKRLAVECDGDRFHPIENLAADMARQAVLERLKWKFHRIRGSKFFRDPDKEIAKLFDKLSEMGIPPESDGIEEVEPSKLVEEIGRSAEEIRREWAARRSVETAVEPLSPRSTTRELPFSDEPSEPAWTSAVTEMVVEPHSPRATARELPFSDEPSDPVRINAVMETAIPVSPREAWEMTLSEWRLLKQELEAQGDVERLRQIGGMGTDHAHRYRVTQAVQNGQPVPLQVLQDYPDLLRE